MTPKPYKDFESAVLAYKNSVYLHSEIKIKCNENNMGRNERTLIDAAFLCKILTTIKYQMIDSCKKIPYSTRRSYVLGDNIMAFKI